jgi:cytochrome c peroxidase
MTLHWHKGFHNNRGQRLIVFLFVLAATLLMFLSGSGVAIAATDAPNLSLFGPALPDSLYVNHQPAAPELVNLGRTLYFDQRLSKNQDLSCNSCHRLDHYGVDNQPFSPGHKGQLGGRNSPSVYNAAAHVAQFWDGRAADVEAQAQGPILNPVEMAMPSADQVLQVLNSMPAYVQAFAQAFPQDQQPVTYDHLGQAIGAFERGLVTPAPFDDYFAGDDTALNPQQKRGLTTFVEAGCAQCHNGTYFGGNTYQKAGRVNPWPNQGDPGRYKVTSQESDRLVFKVPCLRNVAETGPYFHDGSVNSLKAAVLQMAQTQLGKDLSATEADDIVAFLGSLTGTPPADYIQPPVLPVSTASTPLADPT